MRWQIAHPGQPIPSGRRHLLEERASASQMRPATMADAMSPDLYNSFGAMHGTIMVFLAIVPLAFGAFGNYVVPLQIGAPDMAFPRVNMASYQFYVIGGIDHVRQLLHSRRRGAGGLDFLFAAGDDDSNARSDVLAHRHGVSDHFVAAGRGEFHRHHHPIAGAGHDVDAAAVLCLGAVRDGVSAAAGVSAAGSRGRHAVDGQCSRHEFLPADRPGGGRASWRTSAAAAVRCCGSICSGFSVIRKFTS